MLIRAALVALVSVVAPALADSENTHWPTTRRVRTPAGKTRLLGVGRRNPARHRLTAGGKRIRTCMGLFLSSRVFGLLPVLCSERGKPFFVPSPAIRFAARAEGVKGPKR
jgi:hypothetical protein